MNERANQTWTDLTTGKDVYLKWQDHPGIHDWCMWLRHMFPLSVSISQECYGVLFLCYCPARSHLSWVSRWLDSCHPSSCIPLMWLEFLRCLVSIMLPQCDVIGDYRGSRRPVPALVCACFGLISKMQHDAMLRMAGFECGRLQARVILSSQLCVFKVCVWKSLIIKRDQTNLLEGWLYFDILYLPSPRQRATPLPSLCVNVLTFLT